MKLNGAKRSPDVFAAAAAERRQVGDRRVGTP